MTVALTLPPPQTLDAGPNFAVPMPLHQSPQVEEEQEAARRAREEMGPLQQQTARQRAEVEEMQGRAVALHAEVGGRVVCMYEFAGNKCSLFMLKTGLQRGRRCRGARGGLGCVCWRREVNEDVL